MIAIIAMKKRERGRWGRERDRGRKEGRTEEGREEETCKELLGGLL